MDSYINHMELPQTEVKIKTNNFHWKITVELINTEPSVELKYKYFIWNFGAILPINVYQKLYKI